MGWKSFCLEITSRWYFLLFVFALTWLTVFDGPVKYFEGDSLGTLHSASSLLKTGDLDLAEYPDFLHRAGYRVKTINDRVVYFFPPGSTLIALPAVAVGYLLGLDVLSWDGERIIQLSLASMFFSACFILLFKLGRRFLGPGNSWALAILFAFGTGMVSTLPTALWSQTPATFLVLLVVYMVTSDKPKGRLFFLSAGLLLGLAVWTRPTALLAAGCWFFIPGRNRQARLAFLVGLGAAGLLLLLYAKFLLGTWIHPYYQPGRMDNGQETHFLRGVLGNLLSPSRGLLVVTPFLLPILIYAILGGKKLWHDIRFRVAVIWVALLVLWVGRFPHWWGGWCFGNRLLIDALPPLFLITVFIIRDVHFRGRGWSLTVPLILLGGISVVLHFGQGYGNPQTVEWCKVRNIDHHPEALWDWHHPQWLASESMMRDLEWSLAEPPESVFQNGEVVAAGASGVLFLSFNNREAGGDAGGFRWSKGDCGSVAWGQPCPGERREGELTLRLGAFGEQLVKVFLNGAQLGEISLSGFPPREFQFQVPADLPANPRGLPMDFYVLDLKPDHPDSRGRKIGVSFWDLSLTWPPPPAENPPPHHP